VAVVRERPPPTLLGVYERFFIKHSPRLPTLKETKMMKKNWLQDIKAAAQEQTELLQTAPAVACLVGAVCALLCRVDLGDPTATKTWAALFRVLADHHPVDSLLRTHCRNAMTAARAGCRGPACWQLGQVALGAITNAKRGRR